MSPTPAAYAWLAHSVRLLNEKVKLLEDKLATTKTQGVEDFVAERPTVPQPFSSQVVPLQLFELITRHSFNLNAPTFVPAGSFEGQAAPDELGAGCDKNLPDVDVEPVQKPFELLPSVGTWHGLPRPMRLVSVGSSDALGSLRNQESQETDEAVSAPDFLEDEERWRRYCDGADGRIDLKELQLRCRYGHISYAEAKDAVNERLAWIRTWEPASQFESKVVTKEIRELMAARNILDSFLKHKRKKTGGKRD